MKVKQLIKRLQEFNPDAEVKISEMAYKNVHDVNSIFAGWFIDDGFDAPEIILEEENPEDYDIDKDQEKIVCIE